MEEVRSVTIEFDMDDVHVEEGTAKVDVSIRKLVNAMNVWNKGGALPAVLTQIANSFGTDRLSDNVVEYLFEMNTHPTLLQGVLNICWNILVKSGYKLEDAYTDIRLDAGKELTTKLAKMVDACDLPGNLPCN